VQHGCGFGAVCVGEASAVIARPSVEVFSFFRLRFSLNYLLTISTLNWHNLQANYATGFVENARDISEM
jgi:hypothetical protein